MLRVRLAFVALPTENFGRAYFWSNIATSNSAFGNTKFWSNEVTSGSALLVGMEQLFVSSSAAPTVPVLVVFEPKSGRVFLGS